MPQKQALEGLKVVSFGRLLAGPLAAKHLADHGATVVKVESSTKVDQVRVGAPYAGGIPGMNRSGYFALANNNKYSMCLNLKHYDGIAVAKELIVWADVLIENLMPGMMAKWGLGNEEIMDINPNIIIVRASMQGQTGPYAGQPGVGTLLQGLAGFIHFVGWPDRSPVGMPTAVPDYIAPWYIVAAVMAALDRRRKTGKGLYIDLSQYEASITFLSTAILDYTANNRIQQQQGNRHASAAPHGAYRCQGDDRWCVIAVFEEEEWDGFCKAIGNPDWTKEAMFSTLRRRKNNEDALDKLVEEWTIQHSAEKVMELMQAAGVPAAVVESNEDLFDDPQLQHRKHFRRICHPEMGSCAYSSPPFQLSKTPAEMKIPAPCLGEHTEYVCREILGMPDERFVNLTLAGVFE